MKTLIFNFLFVVLFFFIVSISACCQEDLGDGCIDEEEICETCPCTYEYDPVCGCDGVTYGNPCAAEVSGVQEYTEGECSGGN